MLDSLFVRGRSLLRARGIAAQRPERQVGAIPYTVVGGQVVFLLVTSRRTGRWIFPKGAMEGDEPPWETATLEALEEAGVQGRAERVPVGSYRSTKKRGLRQHPIIVDMYPLRVEKQHDDWYEKGQRHRHWVVLAEAKRLLAEPGLAELAQVVSERESQTDASRS